MVQNATSQQEYNAFRKWAEGKYGWWKVNTDAAFSMNTFQNSPYYNEWKSVRGGGGVTATPSFTGGTPEMFSPEWYNWIWKNWEAPWSRTGTTRPTTADVAVTMKTTPTGEEDKGKDLGGLTPEEMRRLALLPITQWEAQQRQQQQFQTGQGQWENAMRQAIRASSQRDESIGAQGSQDMANIYEQVKQEILSTLTQPSDWITRWELQNKPNPYTSQTGGAAIAQEKIEQLMEQESEIGAKLGVVPETQWKGAPEYYQLKAVQAELEQLKGEWAEPPAPKQARVASTPPAPAWLSRMVPSQIRGQPITKTALAPPSGQSLTRLTPTESAGMAGYADWAGGMSWNDLMNMTRMMQPQMPTGAGRTQWAAARQRA